MRMLLHSAGVNVTSTSQAAPRVNAARAPKWDWLRSWDSTSTPKPRHSAAVVSVTGRATPRSASMVPVRSSAARLASVLKRLR